MDRYDCLNTKQQRQSNPNNFLKTMLYLYSFNYTIYNKVANHKPQTQSVKLSTYKHTKHRINNLVNEALCQKQHVFEVIFILIISKNRGASLHLIKVRVNDQHCVITPRVYKLKGNCVIVTSCFKHTNATSTKLNYNEVKLHILKDFFTLFSSERVSKIANKT